MLEANKLSCGYGKNLVVENVDFQIDQSEWISILGANGSGKSTLLKTFADILEPIQGEILIQNEQKSQKTKNEIAKIVAYLPQKPNIPKIITVRELVAMGRYPYGKWWQWGLNDRDLKEVEHAIKLTDLEQYSDCLVEELSGGEVQRAFIALALAQKAEILLLDEPTTFLDIQFQIEILDLIKKIKKERNIAVISVIHDINLASRYSDKIGLITKGRMLQLEEPEKILDKQTIKNTFSIDVETMSSSLGQQYAPYKKGEKDE
tara:strand:+ start:1054 stop:1839 length:786 start_codon:yes stop_codon:yes gene_type:complete